MKMEYLNSRELWIKLFMIMSEQVNARDFVNVENLRTIFKPFSAT